MTNPTSITSTTSSTTTTTTTASISREVARELAREAYAAAMAQFDPELVAKSRKLSKAITSMSHTAVQSAINAGADPSFPYTITDGMFETPWTTAILEGHGFLFSRLLGNDRSKVPLAISGTSPKTVFEVIAEQPVSRIDKQKAFLLVWMESGAGEAPVEPPWRREALWSMAEIVLSNKKESDGPNAPWQAVYFSAMADGGIPASGPAILEYLAGPSFSERMDGSRLSRIDSLLSATNAFEIFSHFLAAGLSSDAVIEGNPLIYHAAKWGEASVVSKLLDAGATVSKAEVALCSGLTLEPGISNMIHATAAKHEIDEVIANVRMRNATPGVAKGSTN